MILLKPDMISTKIKMAKGQFLSFMMEICIKDTPPLTGLSFKL